MTTTTTKPDTIAAARTYLADGTATRPTDALALARFMAEGREYIEPDGKPVTVAEIGQFTIKASAHYDYEGIGESVGDWLGTIEEQRDWDERPLEPNQVDVSDAPNVMVYRPGGRTIYTDCQPNIATDYADYMTTKGGRPRGQWEQLRRQVLNERASYAANYESYRVRVYVVADDGSTVDETELWDCASHDSSGPYRATHNWVQLWFWETVADLMSDLAHDAESTAERADTDARTAAEYAELMGNV